ncbi:SMC-Scp complex subunit ScpB [Alkalicoccus luteus]|uniref:SMC-Scp complex subunit ScpB n=1 Tax=Alkalicoccus luteus TaxID=1237094 RepID=UPI00403412AF
MINEEIKGKLEGLLFVAGDEGMEKAQLLNALECTEEELELHAEALHDLYESGGRGIALQEVAGGYQLTTRQEHAAMYKKLVSSPVNTTLSQAALECLAVVAYRQPVSRMEIEDIRGVKTDRPLRTLQNRGLIEEAGRKEGAGRAILYGTTRYFLEQFGLQTLSDLPPLEEAEEGREDFDLFFDRFQEAVEEES